ncbi:V-type ATP synthase subunit A [candidate division KSB1 bacterium]|nr:V-type ATP synthase subunit A [candidate division KSB1 bacterium]
MKEGKIIKVSGPLVVADGMDDARMFDVVKVSDKNLIGEIIELRGDKASIQVYEETGGIGPGEKVVSTGEPLSVELGPGLITSIYDGIQRPLDVIRQMVGDYVTRGISLPGLDREKKWKFQPTVKNGDKVSSGDIIGTVQETKVVLHKIMIPHGVEGEIVEIKEGEFTVEETVAKVKGPEDIQDITMMQRWPVRKLRPYQEKLMPETPLVTGQRVIDALFPIGKGGTACVPGPFGSGKTIIQHQLAKWADAEIIVYVGCGERGNEMTSVLMEFPMLKDPRTGEPLMKRTVLIANTSNMPVAAREASIYTGITIAEYFRDMGYSVALMADSTSRWAEALREMSGRLEEMPGEEGYPAYLPTRLAEFYERAGRVRCLSSDNRIGALSAIGAVSPPGGDLSDPVVQATLKVVKVFWSLEDWLAYERHFPAINWLTSYSLYHDNLKEFFLKEISEDWPQVRQETMALLQKEADLKEIARLVGVDALSSEDRLTLETARSIREDFLHQNAFDEIDTYTSFAKQYRMLKIVLEFHRRAREAVARGVPIKEIFSLPVREEIAKVRFIPEDRLTDFDRISENIKGQVQGLIKTSGAEVEVKG